MALLAPQLECRQYHFGWYFEHLYLWFNYNKMFYSHKFEDHANQLFHSLNSYKYSQKRIIPWGILPHLNTTCYLVHHISSESCNELFHLKPWSCSVANHQRNQEHLDYIFCYRNAPVRLPLSSCKQGIHWCHRCNVPPCMVKYTMRTTYGPQEDMLCSRGYQSPGCWRPKGIWRKRSRSISLLTYN